MPQLFHRLGGADQVLFLTCKHRSLSVLHGFNGRGYQGTPASQMPGW